MRSQRSYSWALFIMLTAGLSASCADDSPLEPDDSTSGSEPECGNGIIEADEVCDAAGPTATCNFDCTPAACGDGVLNEAAGELCDDGGESATCNFDCTPAACGDGLVNVQAGEECDDWWSVEGCTYDCTLAECGDGPGVCTGLPMYAKASNTGSFDQFGHSVALSADGNTLAVGAWKEDGGATGIDGDQTNDDALESGAVYVLVRGDTGAWEQQAYVKASSPADSDQFGASVALSGDGSTLVVGAPRDGGDAGAFYLFVRDGAGAWAQQLHVEGSSTGDTLGASVALSVDGNTLAVGASREHADAAVTGGVYVLVRDDAGVWSQQAYVDAPSTGAYDWFGTSVALSADGHTLAVGAPGEDSSATGIGGDPLDATAPESGAAYVFARDDQGEWSRQAYVKASNTAAEDGFGTSVALSPGGTTLAVGAIGEDSESVGIDSYQVDEDAPGSGAVYVFTRSGDESWAQEAYVKASNTGPGDAFGTSVALGAYGDTLAVGAPTEDSGATGIDGNGADDGSSHAGAVYAFVRDDAGVWAQQAYIKAPNTNDSDYFGTSVALASDHDELAVGAPGENSSATGIGGDQADDSANSSGAVYLY